MQSSLVSVMMPAYNAETYIGPAIDSVLAQTYPDWELVIVEDGSNDRTADIVSQYGDKRIKVIRQENKGEAAARNISLANIRGELIAFLDADDLYLPHHLESTVGFLLSRHEIDGVYTDGYYIDGTGRHLQTLSSRRRGPFEGNLFQEVVFSSDVFGPPACVVLRTKLIFDHGLRFDEDIVIGPDWDFFMKYSDLGTFGYIDQITCLYRLHTSNISVRTGFERRALELAKCRMNAIKMENFSNCSVRTRTAVFYDLLVNLLMDFPERQLDITRQLEFSELPKQEQARLFRLMASKTIVYGKDQSHVSIWLDKARSLSPSDRRAALLWLLFRLNPKLLSRLLKVKVGRELDPRTIPPFVDVRIGP